MSRLPVLFLLSLTAVASVARAEVNVSFLAPERFTDTARDGGFGRPDKGKTLDEFKRHLAGLGERCIPPGQSLDIVIRDIDLAGQQEPRRGADGEFLRVLKGVSNPRIDLEYVWRSADGTVLGKGAERVAEASFLPERTHDPRTNDSLYYEKAMLTQWFEARFCKSTEAPKK